MPKALRTVETDAYRTEMDAENRPVFRDPQTDPLMAGFWVNFGKPALGLNVGDERPQRLARRQFGPVTLPLASFLRAWHNVMIITKLIWSPSVGCHGKT